MRPSSIPKKRWQLFPTAPATLRQRFNHLSPVLVQILYNRGLTMEAQVQGFLEGHYLASTDPMLLEDMETAVNRIGTARQNDETIIVYGDFDADGVTSTVLLVEALRGLKRDGAAQSHPLYSRPCRRGVRPQHRSAQQNQIGNGSRFSY
ncbi:MAG: hypothetical protein IPL28_27425 [Chloroflexi bacterium]|nr:hypothetical protein [Chloroflexota bacterium]